MKAQELYRLLHEALGPWFAERGFSRLRDSRLTYQREDRRGAFQTIWYQCDKYGWDQYAGSSFFVNFSVSASPAGFEIGPGPRQYERLNVFLTDEELEVARALRNAIVSRIPKPPDSHFQMLEESFSRYPDGAGMTAALRAQFEPDLVPYTRGRDLRLPYFRPEDVRSWTAFIAPVLPRALDEMTSWLD